MSHFRTPNGALHFLDDDSFAHMLPEGAVMISDSEADEIRAAIAAAPPGARPAIDPPGVVRYRAFYLSPPSWVGATVNLPSAPNGQGLPALGEVVFDFETPNLCLRACRDGMVMLNLPKVGPAPVGQIEKLVTYMSTYVAHMNAFSVLLDTSVQLKQGASVVDIKEITRTDLCSVVYRPGHPVPSMGAGGFSSAMTQAMYRYTPPGSADTFWINMREVVSVESIQSAASLLDQAIAIEGAVSNLASLGKAVSEFKIGNYNLALVIAWFVVESVVRSLWESKLDELRQAAPPQSPRINADRLKYLVGNSFGIAAISNSLELMNVLSTAEFLSIDGVRQKRNRVAHVGGAYAATAGDAQDSIRIASRLIERLFGIAVEPSMGYAVSY